MRIVVTGATGNIGTALLRAAASGGTVTSVDAVSRRGAGRLSIEGVPTRHHELDLSDPATGSASRAFRDLARGADALVHLAWGSERSAAGTSAANARIGATVMRAAAEVSQFVLISCAQVYSASYGSLPRSEDWPTAGLPGSSISQDRVGLERMAHRFAQANPDVVMTTIRPAITVQESIGAELVRRFAGPLLPRIGLGDSFPMLLWPEGLRLQVVHADDVAATIYSAIERRAPGAYNVASPQVLGSQEVAEAIGAGRIVELPRTTAHTAHQVARWAHLVRADPQWLPTLLATPVLSADRAARLLGVRATWNGQDALRSAARGVARRREGWTPALSRRSAPAEQTEG